MLGGHFPIKDLLTPFECNALGVKSNGYRYAKDGELVHVRALATGERRPPNAGEWYISGAIPEAYRAGHTMPMSCKHAIAKLVVMRRRMTWEVVA